LQRFKSGGGFRNKSNSAGYVVVGGSGSYTDNLK
jgi:hypothetical protein